MLDKLSSRKAVMYSVYLTAIIVFFALVLLPPILGIVIKWGAIQEILNNKSIMERSLTAIKNSFLIAFFVAAMDVVAGIPMAWLITRGKSRWLSVLDTLSDIPFIVPTAALGYSCSFFGVIQAEYLRCLRVPLFPLDGF
jgi:ABC-type sulfate transport system permease component